MPVTQLPGSSGSFTYDVDPDAGLALARMAGTLTGTDMLAIVQAVHDDPRWRSHFDAIWDCRVVLSHAVTPPEVELVVDEVLGAGVVDEQTGRDVMIEASGAADTAISQLIAALCRRAGKEVRAVATLAEALAVLDRDALPPALTHAAATGP